MRPLFVCLLLILALPAHAGQRIDMTFSGAGTSNSPPWAWLDALHSANFDITTTVALTDVACDSWPMEPMEAQIELLDNVEYAEEPGAMLVIVTFQEGSIEVRSEAGVLARGALANPRLYWNTEWGGVWIDSSVSLEQELVVGDPCQPLTSRPSSRRGLAFFASLWAFSDTTPQTFAFAGELRGAGIVPTADATWGAIKSLYGDR